MQRNHDVISSFGGKTSYDADNRPLLVRRSNLWASGYDVDGTDQTSLGQFSGRVQQTYKHSVPRFFVPEHGTMFTLALVRFFFSSRRRHTSYIGDWSSDVCSSDLECPDGEVRRPLPHPAGCGSLREAIHGGAPAPRPPVPRFATPRSEPHHLAARGRPVQIGRASCRERV